MVSPPSGSALLFRSDYNGRLRHLEKVMTDLLTSKECKELLALTYVKEEEQEVHGYLVRALRTLEEANRHVDALMRDCRYFEPCGKCVPCEARAYREKTK